MFSIRKIAICLFVAMLLLIAMVAYSPLAAINAVTRSSTYNKVSGISYGSDPRQKLDIYAPRNLQAAHAKAPVVVFFYGGNWNSGARQDYAFVGEALASRGIVAVVADYRLYPQVRYPYFVEDCAKAVAWAVNNAAHYGADPDRLYVMGHSAGAYNAAMLALDERWLGAYGISSGTVRGLIGLAGPYDFIPIKNEATRPVFFYPDTPPDSQPVNHVTVNAPPALLIAPAKDDLVDPQRNTGELSKKLRAMGVHVDEFYFDKTNHVTLVGAISWPLRRLAPVLDEVERFVKSDSGRPRSTIQSASAQRN